MNVQFYINTSPSIKVNKTLTVVGGERACDIMGTVDVMNPTIIVKGTVDSSINYMKIGTPLDRYYFVTDITYTTAGSVIVTGHVDVLRTYKGFLENTTLNYVRGAGNINEVEDTSYPIGDYVRSITWPLKGWNNGFLTNEAGDINRHYVLRVAAGAEAQGGEDVFLSIGQYFILTDDTGTNLFRVDLSTTTPPAPLITWVATSSSTAYQWVDIADIVEIIDSSSSSLGQYKFMNQGQFAYIVPV